MLTRDRQPGPAGDSALATVGVAAIAVVCCAGLPLVAGLAGSVALGTVLGIGAGLGALVVVVAAVVVHVRRAKAPTRGGPRA